MGGYASGQDVDLDIAYKIWPDIVNFLKQNPQDNVSVADTVAALKALLGGT